MTIARTITLGIVAGFATSAAAVVPLDRPTPPPCCVDGVCYAHAGFGYVQTRWRVWPGVSTAPMPTVKAPVIRQIPGIPPFETPTPEEEDRQAPEPTKSPSAPSTISVPPGSVPQTVPLDSLDGSTPTDTPSTPRPLTTPGYQPPTTTPSFPRPTTTPGFPAPTTQPPVTSPPTTPFGGQPSADLDLPPAPPFAAMPGSAPRNVQPVQPASRPVANWSSARTPLPPAAAPSVRTASSDANDPPPALPLALGNAAL